MHVLRFAFLGGLLALVIANVSTSDDAFSCRLCETGLSADADSPDFLAPQALDAAVFAQLAEGDAERTSSRTPALDPAAAGAGSGGETLPGPDEPMPTTRPCPGYRTIEEMMAAASS